MLARYVILGVPKSKKNSKRIVRAGRNGPPLLISSRDYLDWERSALHQIKAQRSGPTLTCPVYAYAVVYQAAGQAIDYGNALEGAWDVLEKTGVLKNDYQIAGIIGYRDRDRENPRIEIELYASFEACLRAAWRQEGLRD